MLHDLIRLIPDPLKLNNKNEIREKKYAFFTKNKKLKIEIRKTKNQETKKQETKKLKIQNSKSPSPTFKNSSFVVMIKAFSERMSLFISSMFHGKQKVLRTYKGLRAVMTVEASILLPLFLFAMLTMSGAIEMIRLHSNLQTALWNTGRKLALYGVFLSDQEDSFMTEEMKDLSVSYLYVKGQICSCLGEEYLENSPLTYGVQGLQFVESEIFTEDDCMELNLTYKVSAETAFFQMNPFRMANRYYGHLWNGYDLMATPKENLSYVYVTEYGEVYHRDRNCTHISLAIREIGVYQLEHARNLYGGKYKECEKCCKRARSDTRYIADEGDKFHYDRDCPGLKRSIYTIPEKEASKYRPCSRCVGRN